MSTENISNLTAFPQVVVVEASAGSGKTYELAKRFLYLLMRSPKNSSSLRTILAITFTNKATLAMKERILEFLKIIALDSFSSPKERQELLAVCGLDAKEAQRRAHFFMGEIVGHYNFFGVQTIDSFINHLLLGCALNIDRSASFKIKRDYREDLSYCLDLVIDQATAGSEVAKFLKDFLEHYLFVETRGGWFPKDDILGLMQSLFRLSNQYGTSFSGFPGKGSEVISLKRKIYKLIKELYQDLPPGFNATAAKSLSSFLEKDEHAFNIASLPACLQKQAPVMNKGKESTNSFLKKWQSLRSSLNQLIELDARIAYNPYLKFFSRLSDFFREHSRKQDIIFLEELNSKAGLLFDREGFGVAEVYYRLATRFRHYLVDEFQDTSILQWLNLNLMVEEALSTGGSLFYVGDKKQAIYRFRGGRCDLFDNLKEKYINFNVIDRQLLKNWRSQKAIVEFNNKVFSKENIETGLQLCGIAKELESYQPGLKEIASVFKDSGQDYDQKNSSGYVFVERIEDKNLTQRDEIIKPKLLKLIKELTGRFRRQDIAILTRDNSEVELLSSWCLGGGYSVESEKTLNLIENSAIKEIVSFLSFLHSPLDNISFAAFISGDIFCRANGLKRQEIRDYIFGLHKEKALREASLYWLFRRDFSQIWDERIDLFFKQAGFISSYELLILFFETFAVFNNFSDQQAFFMKLLELLKEKEAEYIGLGEFLDYLKGAPLEDLYVNVAHSESIKILTTHKAKGLEFPVVIIPFLRMDIKAPVAGRGTNSYVFPNQGGLSLLRITKNHCNYSELLQQVYLENYTKACIDELNNIYVALTRAQFELYVFIPAKSGLARNKVDFFIPDQVKEYGRKSQYPTVAKDKEYTFVSLDVPSYQSWSDSLTDEFSGSRRIADKQLALAGNFIHAALSQVSNCRGLKVKAVVDQALDYAGFKYPLFGDRKSWVLKLESLIANKELKDVFYPQGQVLTEKEIANRFGDLKRIDRLIIGPKEAWVIDYKSSSRARDWQVKQIKQYLDIIKDIYPGLSLRGFLLYLDQESLEEVT